MPLTEKQFNKAVCILKNTYDDPTVDAYLKAAITVHPDFVLAALLTDSLDDSPYVSIPFLIEELELDPESESVSWLRVSKSCGRVI